MHSRLQFLAFLALMLAFFTPPSSIAGKTQKAIKQELIKNWSGVRTYQRQQSGEIASDKESQDPFTRFKKNWSGIGRFDNPPEPYSTTQTFLSPHASYSHTPYRYSTSRTPTHAYHNQHQQFHTFLNNNFIGKHSTAQRNSYQKGRLQSPDSHLKSAYSPTSQSYSTPSPVHPQDQASRFQTSTAYAHTAIALHYQGVKAKTPEGRHLQNLSRQLSLYDINRFYFPKGKSQTGIPSSVVGATKAIKDRVSSSSNKK